MSLRPVNQRARDLGVDAAVGRHLVEVTFGVNALRSVRERLMRLAFAAAERPEAEGFLVLINPTVTWERLVREWQLAASVLQPDLLRRLSFCVGEGESFTGIPRDPSPEVQRVLAEVVAAQRPRADARSARTDASFVVLKILLHHWLTNGRFVTTGWLEQVSGYTYPTVANVLERLGGLIERHSDRRVRLRWFPQEEYARLLALASRSRFTVRYEDRSGQPRSPERHLARLEKLNPPGLALGGVLGAKYHLPDLDLVGTPRLDLSLHCPGRPLNLDFIGRLDPALERVADPLTPARVVVHAVHHADPLFTPQKGGLAWADPVECLLDLHEAGLGLQETQLLGHLRSEAEGRQLAAKRLEDG